MTKEQINHIVNKYCEFQREHEELEENDLNAYDEEYDKWVERMANDG